MKKCSKKWIVKMKMTQFSSLSLEPYSSYLTAFAVSVPAWERLVAHAVAAVAIVEAVALEVEWLAAKLPIPNNSKSSRVTNSKLKQKRMHVSRKFTSETSSESRT